MPQKTLNDHLVDHLPHIRRIVSRIAKDEGVVDDITQECCARIIEKEELWNQEKKVLQWINTVTRHLTFDILTKRKTRLSKERPLDEEPLVPSEKDFSEEDIRWVISQFKYLTPMQKKVMNLKYFEGMKGVEISKNLGISEATVSEHLSQSLKALKKRAHHQGLLSLLFPWNWNMDWMKVALVSTKIKFASFTTIVIIIIFGLNYIQEDDNSKITDKTYSEIYKDKSDLSKNDTTIIKEIESRSFQENFLDKSTNNFEEETEIPTLPELVDTFKARIKGKVLIEGIDKPVSGVKVIVSTNKSESELANKQNSFNTHANMQIASSFSSTTNHKGEFEISISNKLASQENLNIKLSGASFPKFGFSDGFLKQKLSIKGSLNPLINGETREIDLKILHDPIILCRLTNKNGEPISGVSVQETCSLHTGGRMTAHVGTSDKNGELLIFNQELLTYFKTVNLGFAHPDYKTKWIHNILDHSKSSNLISIDIVLNESYIQVSGKVYDQDNIPISGATISARKRDSHREVGIISRNFTTNNEGQYFLKGYEPGNYALEVKSKNLASIVETIEIPSSGKKIIDFHLIEGGIISGKIVDADGQGTSSHGIFLKCDQSFDKQIFQNHKSDTNGLFKFEGLPLDRKYTVTAHTPSGYSQKIVDPNTENLIFGNEKRCQVTINFIDEVSKQKVSNSGNLIFFHGNSSISQNISDSTTQKNVVCGSDLKVYISIDGYIPIMKNIPIPEDSENYQTTVSISKSPEIIGKINLESNIASHQQTNIYLLDDEFGNPIIFGFNSTFKTDEEGNFKIKGAAPGRKYRLLAIHPNFAKYISEPIFISESGDVMDVTIHLKAGSSVKGTIFHNQNLNSSGIPLKLEGSISKFSQDFISQHLTFTATSQLNGNYEFNSLPPGSYTLTVEEKTQSFEIVEGQELILDITIP